MALKDTIELVVGNLRQGRYRNEQSISMMVVLPILGDLGWDTRNPDLVSPEFSVKNGRVDYALCFPVQHPKVFVEVKQPGKADGADEQLFDYALRHGVRMALLTDGRSWSFYLPGEEGSYEDRRVYKLDLLERTFEDAAERLLHYLAQQRIATDAAINDAVRELRDRGRRSLAVKTIPLAWQALVEDEDATLIERIMVEVEAKCGVRPEVDDILRFLSRQATLGTAALPVRGTPPPPQRPPAAPPVQGPIGFSLDGKWHPCRSAKDVLIGLLREFAQRDTAFNEKCYRDEDNRGRSRTYISQNRYELYRKDPQFAEKHSEEFVPGWFVATNLSNGSKRNVIGLACRAAGVTPNVDVSFQLE